MKLEIILSQTKPETVFNALRLASYRFGIPTGCLHLDAMILRKEFISSSSI